MMHRIFFAFIWIIGRVLLWIYRVDVNGNGKMLFHLFNSSLLQ